MTETNSNQPIEAEVVVEPDRAPGRNVTRTKPLTVLREAAGRARLADPRASEGRIMLRAGFSASSARNPFDNLSGQTTRDLALRVVQEQPDRLSDLTPLALKTLRQVMSDEDISAQTRTVAAAGTLRLAAELGDDDLDQVTADELQSAHILKLRLLRLGILMATHHGVEAALQRVDQASVAATGMVLREAARRRPAPSTPARRPHREGS
jgi:hypothetical protein